MLISAIVAVSENEAIGKDGVMPWGRIPEDMKWFRQHTLGKPILMGRKTHESIGMTLKGRQNIVLTRDTTYWPCSGSQVAKSMGEALGLVGEGTQEVVVIGGAEIYALFASEITRVYLTRINHKFEGDTYFPYPDDWPHADDGEGPWSCESLVYVKANEGRAWSLSFQIHER